MFKLFRSIMNKRKPNLAKLKPKLVEEQSGVAVDIKPLAQALASNSNTKSENLTPKKTRNKIKNENVQRPSKLKSETVVVASNSNIKLENLSPKKTRNKIKIEYDQRPSKLKSEIVVERGADETEIKKPKWEPKNWIQTLENIRKMREDQSAPVDTMGCHKCHDDKADAKTQRYHILIALMLSSQTKDQTNFAAMQRLKEHGLTPKNIVESDANALEKLINPVSFYKIKTKHIQKASQILIDEYSSDIPNTLEGLLKLPGVGPKMAHICMNSAWNIVTGIGVDVHVHRISNRMKWVPKPTKEPEQTRVELEKWLPFEYWTDVNCQLVGFGQTICTPTHPKCSECLNIDCPSRNVKK